MQRFCFKFVNNSFDETEQRQSEYFDEKQIILEKLIKSDMFTTAVKVF